MIGASLASWLRRRRRRRRFNPYVVGAPVFERQLFFGRESRVREAIEALRSGSVVLRGERRIGKTSFLHQLRGRLEHDVRPWRSYPVFVDLQVVTTRDLLRVLVEEASEALAMPASTGMPLRCARDAGEYRATDLRIDLERLVEAQRQRARAPVRLVFLIDEVDAARNRLLLPAWREFARVVADGSDEIRAVLAGVEPAASPGGDGHADFGELQELELTPLARSDAEALVREPVSGAYAYTDRAVEQILDTSRLRPCAIQALCRRAVDRMLDEGRRTVRALDVDVEARGALFSESEHSLP
jgi:hypothetical protein